MIGNNEKGQTENTDGVVQVTGLTYKTTYTNVYIKVYDNAGLTEVTLPIVVTTKPEICKTTYCNGGPKVTCASCSGNGKQGGGYHAVYVESRKYSSSNKWDGDHCYHCGYYHKTGGNWKEFVVRCSFCRKVWTRTVLYIFCWSSFLY